jgi:hypothetical protein
MAARRRVCGTSLISASQDQFARPFHGAPGMSRGECQEIERAFVRDQLVRMRLARSRRFRLLRLITRVDGPDLLVNCTSSWSFMTHFFERGRDRRQLGRAGGRRLRSRSYVYGAGPAVDKSYKAKPNRGAGISRDEENVSNVTNEQANLLDFGLLGSGGAIELKLVAASLTLRVGLWQGRAYQHGRDRVHTH